jgi:hypothetical protein
VTMSRISATSRHVIPEIDLSRVANLMLMLRREMWPSARSREQELSASYGVAKLSAVCLNQGAPQDDSPWRTTRPSSSDRSA